MGLRAWAGIRTDDRAAYRLIAANRTFFYHLTRLTFGRNISPLRYAGVEWLFLRILAAIYFIAFGSIGLQVTGLIGEHGILPAGRYLVAIHETYGFQSYWLAPGIFWIAHSDAFLMAVCLAGVLISWCCWQVIWSERHCCCTSCIYRFAPLARTSCRSSGTCCCSKPDFWRSSWDRPRRWSSCSAGCCSG